MRLFIYSIIIFSFIVFLRVFVYFSTQKIYQNTDEMHQTVTLLSEPQVAYGKQTFTVNNVKVYAQSYPEFHYGDTVAVSGVVSSIEAKNSRYSFLALKNPTAHKVESQESMILQPFSIVRAHIKKTFNASLPPTEAGFLLGIVFGIKDELPKSFMADLKNTGTMHVVAASGMNVTMLAGALLALLSYFLNRKVATVVTIVVLICYAVLSGLDPSIIRASLMAGIAFLGLLAGRQNFSYFALFITICVMLLFTPNQLLSTGFQLSVASTVGIIACKPILDKIMIRKNSLTFLEDVTTTLAAQLVSLPILVTTFGSYSLLSILVNICVLWMIPFLMMAGSVAAVVSFFNPMIAIPFLYVSFPLLALFESLVKFFSAVSISISLPQIPLAFSIGYYCLLGAVVIGLGKRMKNQDVKE